MAKPCTVCRGSGRCTNCNGRNPNCPVCVGSGEPMGRCPRCKGRRRER